MQLVSFIKSDFQTRFRIQVGLENGSLYYWYALTAIRSVKADFQNAFCLDAVL